MTLCKGHKYPRNIMEKMATSSDDEPDGNTSGSSSDTETVAKLFLCMRTYNIRSVCRFLGHRIYIVLMQKHMPKGE